MRNGKNVEGKFTWEVVNEGKWPKEKALSSAMVAGDGGAGGLSFYEAPAAAAAASTTCGDSALRDMSSLACQSLPPLRAAVPGVCGGAAQPRGGGE